MYTKMFVYVSMSPRLPGSQVPQIYQIYQYQIYKSEDTVYTVVHLLDDIRLLLAPVQYLSKLGGAGA